MTNDKKRRGRPDPQPWVPPQDGVLGAIDSQTKETVFGCQQRVQQIQISLGQIEMQKAQILQQAMQINTEAQTLIDGEATRLGIPPGVPWQMGSDGVARLAPPQGMPQAVPPQAQPQGPRPVVNLAPEPPTNDEDPPADEPVEEETLPAEGDDG